MTAIDVEEDNNQGEEKGACQNIIYSDEIKS
jgi:hypothetical protein